MSASKEIKQIGLPSLKYVSDKVNIRRQLLHDWYNNKYPLFNAVIQGVKSIKDKEGK